MPLSDTNIRNLKVTGKVQKLSDGGGLYLHVSASGGKLWRMAYRFDGKQKTLSFGSYPAISLREARAKREEAKDLLATGVDPGEEKKQAKAEALAAVKVQLVTFESVAREWYEKKTPQLSAGYRRDILSRLEYKLFPFIGGKPFSELEPADILTAVRPVEESGAIETAHKLVRLTGQICRYARLLGYAKFDVASGLSEALSSAPVKHLATLTDPQEISHLLRAIDEYPGDVSILYALRIMPYVFVRSKELRAAKWEEVDFGAAEWRIPANRMKMKTSHVVPLARQVVELFMTLREYSGNSEYLFPSPFSKTKHISDMGLLNAIRRMGYAKGQMTIHGFRGMASTLLNEQGFRADVIEAQLAHCERNAVRKAYNHAQYLLERKQMMQSWADYLDELRANKN